MRYKFLLTLMLSLNVSLPVWATPTDDLWKAIEKSDTAKVKEALQAGANAKSKIQGITTLMEAVTWANLEIFKLLLEQGADITEKADDGTTVLMWATGDGNIEVTKLLLERGADVKQKANNGDTALLLGVASKKLEMVQLLVDKGADITDKNLDGETPIMVAARSGKEKIVNFLLEKGANVKEKDKDGETLLMKAVEYGNTEVAKLLLAKGVDFKEKDKQGKTPLVAAVHRGRVEIAKLLLEKEDNLNQAQRESLLKQAQDASDRYAILSNMHTLQTIVETYAVDTGGVYPANLSDLYVDAIKNTYWKDLQNPFTQLKDVQSTMIEKSAYHPDPEYQGFVVYEPVGQPITKYLIYGCDRDGQLIQVNNKPFSLTNS